MRGGLILEYRSSESELNVKELPRLVHYFICSKDLLRVKVTTRHYYFIACQS